jgi:hypothetical protein
MKRMLASIAIIGSLTFSLPAYAMVTPLFHDDNSGDPGRFHPFTPAVTTTSVNSNVVQSPVSTTGTVGNLLVKLGSAPGAGISTTWTLYKNQVATALSVTVTGAATSGSDNTDNISVVPGDLLQWKNTHTGTYSGSESYAAAFTGTSGDQSLITGGGPLLNTTTTEYMPISGGFNQFPAEADAENVMPTAGTIDNFYLSFDGTAGAGKSYTLTLFKNGVATALTANISNSTITPDTTHSVSFVAGDTLSIQSVPSGTPSSNHPFWSVRFAPTTDGESILFAQGPLNTGGQYYSDIEGSIQSTNADSRFTANFMGFAPVAFTLKDLYANTNPAPGGATSYAFDNWKNGATASALSAAVSGSSTQAHDTTHSTAYAVGDSLLVERTTSGSVASVNGGTAFVAFIATIVTPPPAAGPAFSQFRFLGGLFKIIGGHLVII